MVEVFGLVDDGGRPGYLAVVVDEDVAHDGEHPSFEIGVFHIFVLVVKGFEGGVLKQVVGVVTVGSEDIGEVEKIALQGHEFGLEVRGTHNI